MSAALNADVPEGYKRTDVGVIPGDWEVTSFGDVGVFSKGQGVRKDQALTGNLPCIRYGEIYTHHNDVIRAFKSHISIEVARTSKRIKKGDLLFAGSGETKEDIGKCIALVDDVEAYAGGDIVILSSRAGDPTFLGYLANSPNVAQQKASRGQGDAVVHISATSLAKIKLPFPRFLEQRAIAAALSDMDALLAKLDQLIAKKRDLKQAAMQQLLTGQTRLPGFSGEWEVKRLGDVADIDPENLSSGTSPQYSFKYISLEDVDSGSLKSYSEQVFSTSPSRARRKLQVGDVLVSTVRPNLMSHLLFQENGADWICSTGFAVVRCHKEKANYGFFFAHMFGLLISRQIETLVTGSNYPAINSRDVRAFELPMPSYAEQTAIATVLSDMDAELAALDARRDKTRALKQGMMQALLTGRIRLPITPGNSTGADHAKENHAE